MASQADDTMDQTDLEVDETMRTEIHDAELEESGHDETVIAAPNGTLQIAETPVGSQAKVKEVPVFANMLMSPVVTLIVGADDTHEFAVHRDLLTQCKHFSQLFESYNFVGDTAVSQTGISIRRPLLDACSHQPQSRSLSTTATRLGLFSNTYTRASTLLADSRTQTS